MYARDTWEQKQEELNHIHVNTLQCTEHVPPKTRALHPWLLYIYWQEMRSCSVTKHLLWKKSKRKIVLTLHFLKFPKKHNLSLNLWIKRLPLFPRASIFHFRGYSSLSHGSSATGHWWIACTGSQFNKRLCTMFGFLVLVYKCKVPLHPWTTL